MAAAVQVAPQISAHHMNQHAYDGYANGTSVLEDSEDGEHDFVEHEIAEEDMEHYYNHHYHQQQIHNEQLQYHHYQPGDDEGDLDDDEVYSDASSEESVLPDENIDFSLIYALHTFLATVEGQASVVKGDSLLLLDDANSYWWLVRVLKTEDVGYIPAENVETPYERLARLNKHRNIDIAAPTKEEAALAMSNAPPRETNKLKNFIGWKSRSAEGEVEEREGRRVIFAPPTYVEHPGVTWSSDEETDDEDDDDDHLGGMAHEQHIEDEIEQDLDDVDGYEVEPDDGVEWAQDAVEAMRSQRGQTADSSSTDHSIGLDSRETAIVTPENAPMATIQPQNEKGLSDAVLAGTGAAVAGAGIAATAAAVSSAPAPPNREPSPAAVHSALARTNPTPPPHRAGAFSTELEASPEYNMRDVTTPPATSTREPTPASPDVHTPSTPTPQAQSSPSPKSAAVQSTPTAAQSTPVQSTPVQSTPAQSTPIQSTPAQSETAQSTPIKSAAVQRSASTSSTTPATSAPAAAPPPATPASPTTPLSKTHPISSTASSPTAAVATSPGPPTGKLLTSQPRPMQWHKEAFNISRLSTLVRARADEERRTRRPPKVVESDAVQHTYYGEKLSLDALNPDLRAGYVHLQAKMDSFDREIDSLLRALVATY